jgi:queuine tRNA-ribosyltransferase/7-cyano-7-deazaguanine tRNA-ribosyltransferase
VFRVLHAEKDGLARVGRLDTPHGAVETPAFVAVATRATVKGVEPDALAKIGVQMLIANAYHLHLRPGGETVAALGGLAGFSGWTGPTMTDSGGFQIFSLGAGMEHGVGKVASIFPGEHPAPRGRRAQGGSLVRLSEEGVSFRSVVDGSPHLFTPESVIRLERELGADVALVLDECTSPLHDRSYTEQAMWRTHRWAERALAAFERTRGQGPNPGQLLYGIVQGGAFEDLRQESARTIGGMPFGGFAVGGSLGRSKKEMHRVLEWTVPLLPEEKARHLLGIGEIPDLFAAVRRGIDTFDCAAPTRVARNGTVFVRDTAGHRVSLRNARFRDDPLPIDPSCDCPTCRSHSRAYLRHLCVTGELSYYRLATIHNLRFLVVLLEEIRGAIAAGRLDDLEREWRELGEEKGRGDAGR